MINQPVLRHLGRDSYSQPEEVYRAARDRGMDLVTLSDHDSIEGALKLAGRPDFFISEEVTCVLEASPNGGERVLHLGVLGISERQHEEISARRRDPVRLVSFLDEQRIAWCVNHLFSPLTGPRAMRDFAFALTNARALETRNGMMPASTNAFAAREAARRGLGAFGGSDAHAVQSVARVYTVVEGAASAQEFLEGIRAGRGVVQGRAGSAALLTRDVVVNFALGYLEAFGNVHRSGGHAARALALAGLAPLMPLLPIITTLIHRKEVRAGMKLYAECVDAGLAERTTPNAAGGYEPATTGF